MPWVQHLSRVTRTRTGLFSWALAFGLFLSSLVARLALEPLLSGMKFLTFYPAIALATLVFGWRQGLFVLILSALSAWYLFLDPVRSFEIKNVPTAGALVGFVLVSGFILLLVAALRETVRRLEKAKVIQETLFRELQHRVANNLQLVVALLRNAQRDLRNPVAAAETLTDAEERIMAMSQLHRRLHDGAAFTDGLEPLLKEMLANTFRNLPVSIRVSVGETPELSIDQMTAITLLVNEAAMNSAKHVFSKGRGALFSVSLSREFDHRLRLAIHDDGPGLAQIGDTEKASLGMGIMEAFAAQLGGSLEISNAAGASLIVDFAA